MFAFLLACSLLPLAGTMGQAKPDLRIAVNETTIESFPVFAAANPGVELIRVPNGRRAMSELVSGNADAATGSETQVLLNSVSDPRLRIVVTLAECRYRIIARRSAGIRTIADLRGKAIAATPGTSSQYFLSRMLRKAKLNESDVRIVQMEGPDMPAALAKRTIDAVSIWQPHAQNSSAEIANDMTIFEDPAAYTERFNLNTRKDVLADPIKRRVLKTFIQAIAQVSADLRRSRPDLISSLAPKVGLSKEMVMAVWPQFSFPGSMSSGIRTVMNDVETWVAATQNRRPRASRELDSLIDISLLER